MGSAVHPRVCGEHAASFEGDPKYAGSSPRVRGTYRLREHRVVWHRFIPACAGNIVYLELFLLNQAVHPRVCGEHKMPLSKLRKHHGSSPRVRGT